MPVKINRPAKSPAPAAEVPVKEVVQDAPDALESPQPVAGYAKPRPVFEMQKVGLQRILPDINVVPVSGRIKFLVHARRDNWYVILGEVGNEIKLKSRHNLIFMVSRDGTVPHNFVVIDAPEDAPAPTPEVIQRTRALFAGDEEAPANDPLPPTPVASKKSKKK